MINHNCTKRVFNNIWGGRLCTRKGVNQEDGEWWCKQHTPSIIAAKKDERYRKWEAERLAIKHAEEHQHQMEGAVERLVEAATDMLGNAILAPDYTHGMEGATDCYVITLDDWSAITKALAPFKVLCTKHPDGCQGYINHNGWPVNP